MLALREALRELAAAGLVTNDSAEALREVIRFRPLLPGNRRDDPDPTRWLPADFSPSPGRPIVQRRPNLRRLPKWRRPDLPGGRDGWVGRWSLVRTPGIMGPAEDDETRAEAIARQWLDRYGIVTRDWWRRERPAVSWRLIYRELRRLELRGEVRRGYFVRGLAGAQFASAAAVDALRDAAADASAPAVTMSVTDPANAYALPLVVDENDRPALARPQGARGAARHHAGSGDHVGGSARSAHHRRSGHVRGGRARRGRVARRALVAAVSGRPAAARPRDRNDRWRGGHAQPTLGRFRRGWISSRRPHAAKGARLRALTAALGCSGCLTLDESARFGHYGQPANDARVAWRRRRTTGVSGAA